MHTWEKDRWELSIIYWFVILYIGYFAIGGFFFFNNIGYSKQVPQKPSFTLEQLQENSCLGCKWFGFEQTSKGLQYCCRVKDIDVLEHPSQCNQKSYCLEKGKRDFNEYTEPLQFNQNRDSKIRIYWFIFLGLNIIGLILLGLYLMRKIYLRRYQHPRPFQRVRKYLTRNIAQRRKAFKTTKTKVDFLNEEMETKNPCFDKQQVARQVKE